MSRRREEPGRTIELTDPRALRAVAHPIRLELMGLLRRSGPLTATEAAKQIGESPSSCSFHLRQLAKYGLVEEAGGGQGRQRPWRATAAFTEWRAEGEDGEHNEAATMFSRVVVERYFEQAIEWLEREGSEPREWTASTGGGDNILYLTAAELAALEERVRDLFEPYYERLGDPSKRPRGARAINYIRLVHPLPDLPAEE